MKFKKLLISASVIAAGTGLLATVLTSCSKSKIDEDLKIKLDDEGRFVNFGEGETSISANFKDALKNALGRSSGWEQFKTALAEEIVLKWYEDRAAPDKKSDSKNKSFRNNLEDWKHTINKDYDSIVDNCKSKYGANWKFYLQNENLVQNGGTEESYKRIKLLSYVKTEFIKNVFAQNYFGYASKGIDSQYPFIKTPSTMTPTKNEIGDPEKWQKYGFFGKTNSAFDPGDTIDPDYLAKHPDGDYAAIQDFVFNRWFDTEKPFFSAAALFKYSNPAQSGGKLESIYNKDWVSSLPESPNEAYPFFGAIAPANGAKGTQAFWEWYWAMMAGEFETDGLYGDKRDKYNGTITMNTTFTEDSQTLLLCTGSDIFTSLYTPYAIAAANLYGEMFDGQCRSLNTMTQAFLEQHVGSQLNPPTDKDDSRLLSCFFWSGYEKRPIFKSYFDLSSLYDSDQDGDYYHCSIFARNDNYPFLYGDMNATNYERNGVKYVSNSFEVPNLGRDVGQGTEIEHRRQPWILEMNEAGVHAQTIDGYQYVRKTSSTDKTVLKERLKDVVKYRLMEDKCYDEKNLISANVFGSDDNAKLYKYFNDNFADIILEMVADHRPQYNIFRNIDSYGTTDQPKYFVNELMEHEKLGDLTLLETYIGATIDIKRRQRILSAIESANNKIYEYRKTQIDNAKNRRGKKRYENGLLAPMPVEYSSNFVKEYGTSHHYYDLLAPITFADKYAYSDTAQTNVITRQYVRQHTQSVINQQYVKNLDSIIPNSDEGFSPQIQKAKEIESNRFWYKSSIVDRVMYSLMAGSTIVNQIKGQTYKQYTNTKALADQQYKIKDVIGIDPTKITTDTINNGVISTYISNRMLSGSNNFATYTDNPDTTDFFGTILSNYQTRMTGSLQTDGEYNDDNLNYWLFLSTVAYLAKNNFEKLYDSLATRIHENELAYVAYVTKFNYLALIDHKMDYDPAIPMESVDKIPFQWKANVDNIFDKSGYSGQTTPEEERESWNSSFDQYWHIVQKQLFGTTNSTLAGFMGIQSASSNQFDQNSGLKDAATKDFATATYDSPSTPGGSGHYAQNEGVLFPWAYNGDEELVDDKYDFGTITDPKGESTEEITINTFINKGLVKAGKLAYNIAQCSTIDDLKTLAGTLSDAIYGHSIFSDIANGSYPIDKDHPVEDLKFIMLHEFVRNDSEATDYTKYFNRLVNVELHTNIEVGGKYYFRDAETNDCYKIMLTQLNKSDLVDKLIAPEWKTGYPTGHWEMKSNSGLTLDEFWYILFNAACDNANQQAAISDAVKNVFGDEKLVVYDAQIYNQFDSLWIKDWKRKTMP